jgi:hypothetical protein
MIDPAYLAGSELTLTHKRVKMSIPLAILLEDDTQVFVLLGNGYLVAIDENGFGSRIGISIWTENEKESFVNGEDQTPNVAPVGDMITKLTQDFHLGTKLHASLVQRTGSHIIGEHR